MLTAKTNVSSFSVKKGVYVVFVMETFASVGNKLLCLSYGSFISLARLTVVAST